MTVTDSPGATEAAPELLLLSGLLSDETVWGDVARRLAGAARVRIISFPGLASIAAMAEAVERVAPPRFAIVGHSMGGRVALELWRRHPQRVAALGLFNSGVHPCTEHEPESRGALLRLGREQGMAAVATAWLPPMMGAASPRRDEVLPLLTAMVERQTVESFAAQTTALLGRPDARPVLPTIRVPVLLASGRNDAWSPVAQHADMQRHIPQATLEIIEDSGHMAPIEQPEAVAEVLRSWLGLR